VGCWFFFPFSEEERMNVLVVEEKRRMRSWDSGVGCLLDLLISFWQKTKNTRENLIVAFATF